ncbi:hypothetical protein IW261DRAFT_1566915 [Armillaria novae-zelandiae]|uniref:Uncharacterized protein n=1 Tax=Armillaria novae-zelandiae TaxID=153914 RepID=A0AA39P3G5_9AGAR|nr:hypothetical protein IW261DRAFT_1566915 [Armillaria novae-zelandiae]
MSLADLPATIGTPAFFPRLLATIQEAAFGTGIPLDVVILRSILLCFISGDKHLILHAEEEDIPHVQRIAVAILSSLFGVATHKLRIRRPDSEPQPRHSLFRGTIANPFLRSLFLPGTPSSSSTLSSVDDTGTASKEKRRSGSRSTTKRQSRHYSRSSSFANDLVNAASLSPNSPQSDLYEDRLRSVPSTISGKETAASSNPFASAGYSPHSPTFVHSFLDSPPFHPSREDPQSARIPHAVVLSGLENASLPSQRALIKALAEKRVVLDSQEIGGELGMDGVWNIPDGFMLIYVCPLNPRERPAIHKNLLDHFSMSATVNLTADVRALCKHLHLTPVLTPTPIPQSLIHALRASYHHTHFPAHLKLYLSDLFTAARHHPALDGMWLTARALRDAADLARASRVLGCDPTGVELVRETAGLGETSTNADEEEVDKFFDVMDGISWDGDVDGSESTDAPSASAVLDVSEADIARIAPRVMTHRLRVRDVDDGVFYGVLSGAAFISAGDDERPTVKSVLVQILAEV